MKAIEEKYSVDQFVNDFGDVPKDSELARLTQIFMETYHRYSNNTSDVIDGFGVDWVELLLSYNQRVEEYELCCVFRDLLNEYKK